jgi:hypothetical protein
MGRPSLPTARNPSGGLKLLLTVLCLVFFAGGCVLGRMAYRAVLEAQQSLTWPTVPGRISRSGVDVSVSRERSNRRDGRYRETSSYSAAIEYDFHVNGKTITGRRVAVMSDQFGSRDWAEATTKNFPVGSDVTVSYNPDRPEECVLEPGRWGGAGFLVILAGGLLFFPLVVLKAIWSSETPDTGTDSETPSKRVLNGVAFRERILAWEPGAFVHTQRNAMSFPTLISIAIIAGLIIGLLFGLVPALLFFSGRGPVFIGQFYLAASVVCAFVGGVWLWLDNRPRETRITWSSAMIHLAVGSTLLDVTFSDVQELNLTVPKRQKSQSTSSGQPPQKHAARINMVVNGKSFIILETECTMDAVRSVRSKLASIASHLAQTLNTRFADTDNPA